MSASASKEEIEESLKRIEHPEIRHTLFELGMIKDVEIDGDRVSLTLNLPVPGVPILGFLTDSIRSAVRRIRDDAVVEVKTDVMSEEERMRFVAMARSAWRG